MDNLKIFFFLKKQNKTKNTTWATWELNPYTVELNYLDNCLFFSEQFYSDYLELLHV